MSQENESPFDGENIFDELSGGDALKQEVAEQEEKMNKDIFFYMKQGNVLLLGLNILAFVCIIFLSLYLVVQAPSAKREWSILSGMCNVFLGSNDVTPGTCYGVTPILEEKKAELENIKESQAGKVLPLLGEIYSLENFKLSRKVSFLLEKTQSRLRPMEVLAAFDDLKNTYSPIDKAEISCYDIILEEGDMFTITCDTFSSDWDTGIAALEGDRVVFTKRGTSISKASSFIYFLENYPGSPFTVISKPETLSASDFQLGPYTQKTTFQLELQYSNKESLSS